MQLVPPASAKRASASGVWSGGMTDRKGRYFSISNALYGRPSRRASASAFYFFSFILSSHFSPLFFMSFLFCFLLSFLYYYYFFFFSVVFFVLFFAFFLFKSSGLLHHLIFFSTYIIKFPFIYQSISPYTQSPSWLIFPLPLNTHAKQRKHTHNMISTPTKKRQKIHIRFTRHLKGNKNVLKTYNIFSVSSKILTVISGAVFYACNRLYTVSLFVLKSLYFMNWWSAFLFSLFGQENNDDNIKKWEQYETGNVKEVT